MAQRRFHYELAFEHYLRCNTIPYVAVDEARRALSGGPEGSLKSFDFVVYARTRPNLILDVKGRKQTSRTRTSLENWVTSEDVSSLKAWERIFGPGFQGVFVFMHWCVEEPPDMLFQEMFEFESRWYAVNAVRLLDYGNAMRARSERWDTVCLSAEDFRRLAQPLRELLA